jgi:hypothetical protein
MARKAKPTKEWEIAYRSGSLCYRGTCQASTAEQAIQRFKRQIKPPPVKITSVVEKGGVHGA